MNQSLSCSQPQAPRSHTLASLADEVLETTSIVCSKETIRRRLHRLGYSFKLAKKLLANACPKARALYMQKLQVWLKEASLGQRLLLFIDEAHLHNDFEARRGWFRKGEEQWVASRSPGLSERLSWYGTYIYNQGRVHLDVFETSNGKNTVAYLRRLQEHVPKEMPVTLIWDGAPAHQARIAKAFVSQELGWELEFLPSYSPDLMPVEALWKWLRSERGHRCFDTMQEHVCFVESFAQRVAQNALEVADRLVVRDHLDPQVEKLRFSDVV